MDNFKNIHIANLIARRMQELEITIERAEAFLSIKEEEIELVYQSRSIDSDILLKHCKLLDYDFFRVYTQHLRLYAPQEVKKSIKKKTSLPVFRKNIYSQEVIDYLIEKTKTGEKTYREIMKEYNIPNTTIMRWVDKYGKNEK